MDLIKPYTADRIEEKQMNKNENMTFMHMIEIWKLEMLFLSETITMETSGFLEQFGIEQGLCRLRSYFKMAETDAVIKTKYVSEL